MLYKDSMNHFPSKSFVFLTFVFCFKVMSLVYHIFKHSPQQENVFSLVHTSIVFVLVLVLIIVIVKSIKTQCESDVVSIYTLNDLDDSSNLIGSLS